MIRNSANFLHHLIGHMVDQQQIPPAIFGGKKKVICQELSVYGFICNYRDTGICQDKCSAADFYTGFRVPK